MTNSGFKVIIVGGSIAGLSLAHCLQRAGIDWVILEKHTDIAPQLGASVGIMPNGGRVLDQLGLYDAVEGLIEPLQTAHVNQPDGASFSSHYPRILNERFGYPLAFLDRQKLLEILYRALPMKENVYVDAQVVRIESNGEDGMRVYTDTGGVHYGDLVVGADGVRSIARSEMWRLSAIPESDKSSVMTVEYACVFGISSPIKGLEAGNQITCFNNGWSILSIIGKGGRIYWFLMLKLEQKYTADNAPRFTHEDALRRCEKLCGAHYWKNIRFGDVWKRREVFSMTNLEESLFQTWHGHRVVCIGDSMHKIAPNTGQGANSAIEDAAALTNLLRRTLATTDCKQKPSGSDLHHLLQKFSDLRIARMHEICESAALAVRLHAQDGIKNKLLGRYILPYAGDVLAERASRGIRQAVALDFIPLPERSGMGWSTVHRTRATVPLVSLALLMLGVIMQRNMMTWLLSVSHR